MSSSDPQRPNILFVLSDDQGAWALGCAGNDEVQTPVLDGLAARGVRLQNFFCASPVCSPARASLLTGSIPSRHGVHDYLDGLESGSVGVDFLAGQASFTSALAENGYRLGLAGKWHLGASDRPRAGFVHWFALAGGGSPYHRASMFRGNELGGVEPETVTGYLTDVLADDALGFLREEAERPEPFFLSLNFTAPHKPFAGQHPEEFERLYAHCAFDSCPQEPSHPWQPTLNGVPIGGEPDTRAALIGYFAAISAMDAAIGRVLFGLTELGLDENTVVVFSSDNGFSCGQHGFWGKGNGTFPQNMYDTSVKVPAIIVQPGRIAPGRVVEELLSAYDVAATLLELVGLDPADFESGPGTSFANLLVQGERPRSTSAVGTTAGRPIVVFDEYGPVRMIRTHDWKYVHRYPHGPHELYDLVNDADERHNLVDDPGHAARVAELRHTLHHWFVRYALASADGAALPVSGAGQTALLADDPLNAFTAPNWDGTSPGTG